MGSSGGPGALGELATSKNRALLSIPCYWDSLLVGVATGGLVAMHRLRGTRVLLSALDWGVKAGTVASLATFAVCRYQFHAEHDRVMDTFRKLKEGKKRKMEEAANSHEA